MIEETLKIKKAMYKRAYMYVMVRAPELEKRREKRDEIFPDHDRKILHFAR
jgi:hypothetical protein